MNDPHTLSTHLLIGEVLKPQGIRGEVKVKPVTCDPERFYDLAQVFFEKNGQYEPVQVRSARVDRSGAYLLLEGVSDRSEAETLRGQLIYIDREHAVQLPEDAEFICDLIGCHGADDEGRDLGELVDVMQPGGNDVYVFRGPLGEVALAVGDAAGARTWLEQAREECPTAWYSVSELRERISAGMTAAAEAVSGR